jgi:HEAT repeat protein
MVVGQLGAEASDANGALCGALNDEVATVRFWAAKSLGEIGQRSESTTERLVDTLRDDDADVRWQAARSLGKIGVGEAAEKALAELSGDPHPAVRAQAAASLAQLQKTR